MKAHHSTTKSKQAHEYALHHKNGPVHSPDQNVVNEPAHCCRCGVELTLKEIMNSSKTFDVGGAWWTGHGYYCAICEGDRERIAGLRPRERYTE